MELPEKQPEEGAESAKEEPAELLPEEDPEPSPTPDVTRAPIPAPTEAPSKYPREAETVKAEVKVRVEPDKKSAKVSQLGHSGAIVTVLDEAYDTEGVLWYYIRTQKGKEGYVRNDMIALR